MTLVWIGLAILAGLGAAVLLAPVTILVHVDVPADAGHPAVWTQIRWLAVSWRPGAMSGRPRRRRKRRTRRHSRRSGGRRAALAALRSPGFLTRVGRLVRDLGRPLVPRHALVRLRAGADDPADTGMWSPVLSAVSALPWNDRYRLHLEPDFAQQTLEAHARVEWSIRLAAFLGPLVRFVLSPVVWRAGWAAVRTPRTV